MNTQVLLDAGVVSRCRRRVHLEHDPAMRDAAQAPPDPAGEQRKADAEAHRRSIADEMARLLGDGWTWVPNGPDLRATEREWATEQAMAGGAKYIWGAVLPRERLQEMIQAYYRARGWDGEGQVPQSLLKELDLTEVGV